MEPFEPIVESGLAAVLSQDVERVLAKAHTTNLGALAKGLVKLVGQIADLEMHGHRGKITPERAYMQSACGAFLRAPLPLSGTMETAATTLLRRVGFSTTDES